MSTRILMLLLLTLSACGVGGRVGNDGQRLLPSMPGVDQSQAERLIAAGAPRMELALIDRGTSALLVKVGERGGVSTWRTVDNTQILTRRGLVIGTRGLSFDMMTAETGAAEAAILGVRTAQVQRFHTYLDGNDRTEIRAYVCDISPAGAETVEIPNGPTVSGALVREVCHSPGGDFTNLYVVREGRILRTLQFISDQVGRAQILFPS
jgi:hypothetical protein